MSIYCSYWGVGDEHDPKCRRIRKVRGGFTQDDSMACTCGSCPIEYAGSHVLPTESDRRNGDLGISSIPDHITDENLDITPWKPFLRFHINAETVVLTRSQVEGLRDSLTIWLCDSKPNPIPASSIPKEKANETYSYALGADAIGAHR